MIHGGLGGPIFLHYMYISVRKNRHGSVGDLVDNSSLSKQNRSLAKSTTALSNMRRASDMVNDGLKGETNILYCLSHACS